MNQKTNNTLAAEMSPRTRIVSYAPVASTHGNRVKIYRYGFEQMGREYRRQLEAELHPLRKAVIRYEWARFILSHLDEYSGDREIFRRSASLLATTAYLEAKQIRSDAERSVKSAQERLRRAEKRAGIIKGTESSTPAKGLTAEEKRLLNDLRYNLKHYRKLQNELLRICPDGVFDNIRHLWESIG